MTDDETPEPVEEEPAVKEEFDDRPDERQRKAAALHIAGMTYREIADRLDYASVSGAYDAVKAGLANDIVDGKGDLTALELRRLDELLLGLWPMARKGSVTAVDRVLKIMERRAKFLGLDSLGETGPTPGAGESELDKQRRAREDRQKGVG